MDNNIFSLLKLKRFLPLFLTQFSGAFNDSLFKNALFILITYRLASQEHAQQLVAFGGGIFILPFFLFSATAGHLADRFDKSTVARYTKALELIAMSIGMIGFFINHIPLLLIGLFLMGTNSAFFGPIKYAILPDHLRHDELVNGTALIEASTFLAILIGTLVGGVLIGIPYGEKIVAVLTMLIAIIGLIICFAIPKAPAAQPNTPISWNIITETVKIVRYACQFRTLYLTILGISWFWLVGATFLTLLAGFTKDILHASSFIVTLFLTVFSLGIGIGAYLCTKIQKGSINAKYVPLGIIGITIFIIDLFFASHTTTDKTGELIGFWAFLQTFAHWRITLDLLLISISSGIYIVPLYTLLQTESKPEHRARVIAANNIFNAFFMVISSVATMLLLAIGLSIVQIFLVVGIFNAFIALIVCQLLPDEVVKTIIRSILKWIYRVKVYGMENYHQASSKAVIVANHVSFLDGLLLAAFLPDKIVVAVNTYMAENPWLKPFLALVDVFAIDPTNPMSMKSLIRKVQENHRCIIFPEGRITVTGGLMKIYEGPGLVADHANADIIPIRIDGPQYTPFSRLKGKLKIRWFPKIRLTILPSTKLHADETLTGRQRRQQIGNQLYRLMTTLMFESSYYRRTLFRELLAARNKHGKNKLIIEDLQRKPLSYEQFIRKALILGSFLSQRVKNNEIVGIMLPNTTAVAISFFACHASNITPCMLNYSMGSKNIQSVCSIAKIKTIITSRQFLETIKLLDLLDQFKQYSINVIFLEDLKKQLSLLTLCQGWLKSIFKNSYYRFYLNKDPDDIAVILFTSGSEGVPKGVALSHTNLQANRLQIGSRIDFTENDLIFNMMPVFHSFGLMAGTLLPLLSGIKVFFYPSPLHYRIIPELVYDCNATVLFGTDTFLAGYAKFAHPYDFYSLRYVVAGAEKLKDETRKLWQEKFGIRILEGYGVTEASPVLSVNTPMLYKQGTVGCLLPEIQYKLESVAGIREGGRLWVKGPNVMLGYLDFDQDGKIKSPEDGWYDTGDIVSRDLQGFITIQGRAKRFAKIGGEMISLTAVEHWITECWPEHLHAVISVSDPIKGEQLVLVTDYAKANRLELVSYFKQAGIAEINLPKRIEIVETMPLMPTGKINYVAVAELL